nr:type I polyketide synthase 4 [Streptomyces sp.]
MSATNDTPIAVIGTGCRFPGGVQDSGALWRLAADGRSTVGVIPADRWDAERFTALHDPELAGRAALGCFLDGDVWAWDPQALSVAPAEREWVDPQTRVLMEVAWEAVENAGVPLSRVRGSRTGVYVGTYAPDNLFREARPVEDAPNSPYLFGNFTASAAGRVAFSMDLRGPVMVVSTHCSSGLVALDTACGALTLGECDMALAGGVLLMLAPQTHYMEAPLLLSVRGACHAFDARADGYVRGEGAGAIVLKRLADARRDGDRILAVIRGSAVNNDGQATRLTAPSGEMQQRLFRRAVQAAGVDPGEVGLVEAHGPGTQVGDPIEYSSIDAVYGHGRGRCALGSVKTNIGHSEPVSGIAGFIKAVECLRRGVIPPNQNFAEFNPAIPQGGESRLFVPTEQTAWPVAKVKRLAAVCSYGVSGTNAHVVLEAAPTVRPRTTKAVPSAPERARLFHLSGNSGKAAATAAARLADWVEKEGAEVPLADIAHTLAVRRHHADHRLGVVAVGRTQLIERARALASGESLEGATSGVPVLEPGDPGPVFVFTGQGSQYPGMCQGLLTDERVFAAAIDEAEPLIQAESGFSVREMLLHPDRLTGVDRIQPTLFAVQVALVALWRSWGVQPIAVIGQSLGEVAASVAAGVLPLSDGVKVICRRANLLVTIAHGAMASVLLGAEDTQAAIEAAGADGVSLGVLTGPATTVISGDRKQVRELVDAWNAQGVVARTVDVDVASHSAQVDPVIDDLRAVLAELPPATAGDVVFYSTVSDDPRTPGPLDADYWVHNQRDTVRFQSAVEAALADGHRLFIECSAQPLATRPVLAIAEHTGTRGVVAVGSLRRGAEDQEAFLTHLATVHHAGYDCLDLAAHHADGTLADVPGTSWDRTRYGGTRTPYTLVAPELPAATQHPLLGGHVSDPERPDLHLWQTLVGPRLLPWLDDHKVAGTPVLPGTGFAEMMLAAAAEVFGTARVALTAVDVRAPLVLDEEPQVTTRLVRDGEQARIEVLTGAGSATVVHAHATARALPAHQQPPALAGDVLSADGWRDSAPADLYRHFRERHDVFHGPAFAALDRIRLEPDGTRALATLRTADGARISVSAMLLHPALADEVVQTAVAAWLGYCATSPGPVVVAGFDEVLVYGPTAHTRLAAVELHHADDLTCTATGRLATADGTVVAELRGLRLANITPPEQRYASRLSHLAWFSEPHRPAPESTEQRWLVVAPEDCRWGRRLHTRLRKRSARSRLLTHPGGRPPAGREFVRALDDETELPCTDLLLALGDHPAAGDPAVRARATVLHVLTVLRQLTERLAPPRLWVMWRGGDQMTAPGIRGLLRTAAFEHPELRASSLETDAHTPLDAVLDDLLDDTLPTVETAWWHGVRSVARVRPGADDRTAGPAPLARRDGTYLVTGGLGGLGLLTARRMARQGAGRIVLCGRTAPDAATTRELEDIRTAYAADLTVLTGDIADPAVVARALAAATDELPMRGVVHAAGVVEDATLTNLDDELLDRVWRGKVEGAWALHRATAELAPELDHFVLYSSVASLIGSPGQGAYAAANAFLDSLAAHRIAQGLPATSVHWGAWSEAGRGQHLARQGFVMITPEDGLDALERVLAEGHHEIAYSPLDIPQWTASYPAVRNTALLAELLTDTSATGTDTAPVRDELLAADRTAERRRILEEFIIGQVRELLGNTAHHIAPHTSMVILGLDSLGAVALQQRLQNALRTEIKPGVIWVKPSAAALAEWLLDQMGFTSGTKEA